jgi:uncharacterized protein (TIGR03086 family)
MATVDQLADALDRTGRLIAGIRGDQWHDPTPCAEWDVRAVVEHLIKGNASLATALGADDAAATDYPEVSARLLEAFRRPGVADGMVTIPFGTVPAEFALHLRLTELLVHGWDIARATGQKADFPDDLAEEELRFSERAVQQLPPGRTPFGPPRPAPDDATTMDRLAALLGRNVT